MALTLVACALIPHLSVDYVSSVRNATRTLPANFQSMVFFHRALVKEKKIAPSAGVNRTSYDALSTREYVTLSTLLCTTKVREMNGAKRHDLFITCISPHHVILHHARPKAGHVSRNCKIARWLNPFRPPLFLQ